MKMMDGRYPAWQTLRMDNLSIIPTSIVLTDTIFSSEATQYIEFRHMLIKHYNKKETIQ